MRLLFRPAEMYDYLVDMNVGVMLVNQSAKLGLNAGACHKMHLPALCTALSVHASI